MNSTDAPLFFERTINPSGDFVDRELTFQEQLNATFAIGVERTITLLALVAMLPEYPELQVHSTQMQFIAAEAEICSALLATPLGIPVRPVVVDVREETQELPVT